MTLIFIEGQLGPTESIKFELRLPVFIVGNNRLFFFV